jgi:hypothetical protein
MFLLAKPLLVGGLLFVMRFALCPSLGHNVVISDPKENS